MATSVSTIRGVIVTALAALDGWRESRWASDLGPLDGDYDLDHTFSVATPETTVPTARGRQRGSEGAYAATTIVVTWACRLRGDAQGADYDAALDAEAELMSALLAIPSAHLTFSGPLSRRADPSGWVLGTVRCSVSHHYDLS